jgi:hypothetical protein
MNRRVRGEHKSQSGLQGAAGSYGELRGVKKISTVTGETRMAIFDHRYRLMASDSAPRSYLWDEFGSLRQKHKLAFAATEVNCIKGSVLDIYTYGFILWRQGSSLFAVE